MFTVFYTQITLQKYNSSNELYQKKKKTSKIVFKILFLIIKSDGFKKINNNNY